MKTKLEIINLSNDDVVATSCTNVWGVTYFGYETDHYIRDQGVKNGTNNNNRNDMTRFVEDNSNITTLPGFGTDGYYHIDASGNIIEKCPYSEKNDVHTAHNIEMTD